MAFGKYCSEYQRNNVENGLLSLSICSIIFSNLIYTGLIGHWFPKILEISAESPFQKPAESSENRTEIRLFPSLATMYFAPLGNGMSLKRLFIVEGHFSSSKEHVLKHVQVIAFM